MDVAQDVEGEVDEKSLRSDKLLFVLVTIEEY